MVQRIRTFVSGLAAITGLLAWIAAGIIAGHTTFYWTRVEKAEGIVTALTEVPCSILRDEPCFDPEVVFVTADRGPITFKASDAGRVIAIEEQSTSLVLTVGQSIPVLYDAKQPTRARIASSALGRCSPTRSPSGWPTKSVGGPPSRCIAAGSNGKSASTRST